MESSTYLWVRQLTWVGLVTCRDVRTLQTVTYITLLLCVCVCVFQVATGNVSDRKASVTASVPELCRPDSRSSDASDLNASTVRLVHAELPIRLVDY